MKEFVRTEDGSLTCRDETTGELFHNRAGAYTEALRNYLEPSAALSLMQAGPDLAVLDVCFGLGYNTFVLLEHLLATPLEGAVSVIAIEPDAEILQALPRVMSDDRLGNLRRLFGAQVPQASGKMSWRSRELTVCLELQQMDLRQFLRECELPDLDLIFHDPFSPPKMPELWSVDIFRRYYRALQARGGKMLTYSASSAVRGGLQEAGFRVFRTAAVGAKSGGTLAAAEPDYQPGPGVHELSQQEREKLATRSAVPHRDPCLTTARADILKQRAEEQGLSAPRVAQC